MTLNPKRREREEIRETCRGKEVTTLEGERRGPVCLDAKGVIFFVGKNLGTTEGTGIGGGARSRERTGSRFAVFVQDGVDLRERLVDLFSELLARKCQSVELEHEVQKERGEGGKGTYLCTRENNLARDENEENDFGFHHSVDETGEKLRCEEEGFVSSHLCSGRRRRIKMAYLGFVRREVTVRERQTFQTNRELDVTLNGRDRSVK